jgi:FKBP-type peptidyl-prolyl cis-trans isomerase
LLALAAGASGQTGGGASPLGSPAPASGTLPTTAFAAIGSSFAQSSHLPELGWDETQIAAFIDGVNAALHGKSYAFDDTARAVSAEMGRRLHELEMRKKQLAVEAFAQPGRLEQYMKEMRKRHSMQQSDSGLLYSILPGPSGGGGVRPRPGDTVVVSCVATAADGTTKLPQLSSDHVRVKMTDLLPGFMEGLQMMSVESQARFILPPALSFGTHEWPEGVDQGTPLLFSVTLHEVSSAEASP